MTTAAKKIKTVASVFELPQRLGILQYVEYEPPPREWCAGDGCLYEGVLTAEGCRRGICVRYRVWVYSRDRRRWEAKEKWRRRDEEVGSLTSSKMYCAQNGVVREVKWELEFKRYEVYEEKIREVYRPKGLLAFAATAREYVKTL
jgi:hypothetical protein